MPIVRKRVDPRLHASLPALLALVALATADGPAQDHDAFGDPLPAGASARFGTTRFRHLQAAFSVAFSPDGSMVASASREGVWLWEVPSGRLIRKLGGPIYTEAVAFSADGKLLASQAHVFDMAGVESDPGRAGSSLAPLRRFAYSLEFVPGGRLLAWSDIGRTLAVIDLETGKQRFSHDASVPYARLEIDVSPDGRWLAAFAWRVPLRIWSIDTGHERTLPESLRKEVRDVAFTKDGEDVVVGSTDRLVRIIDFEDGSEVRSFGPLEGDLIRVALADEDRRLFVLDRTGKVTCWETSTGRQEWARGMAGLTMRDAGYDSFYAIRVEFSRDRRYLAGTGGLTHPCGGTTIHVWDVATGEPLHHPDLPVDEAMSMALSPDGRRLATCTGQGSAHVWDVSSRKAAIEIRGVDGGPIAFTPDGGAVVALSEYASEDEEDGVAIWDATDGRRIARFETKYNRENCFAVSPSGVEIVASSQCAIEFWQGLPLRKQWVSEQAGSCGSLALSPDGRLLATGGASGDDPMGKHSYPVAVWDARRGEPLRELGKHRGGVVRLAFPGDGRHLVSMGQFGDIVVWDPTTGEREIEVPEPKGEQVVDMVCGPGGRLLYVAAKKGRVAAWELSTGERVWQKNLDGGVIACVTVSPDGGSLYTAMADTTVLVWPLPAESRDPVPPEVSPPNWEELWLRLADRDSWSARRAFWTLVALGDDAVPFLRGKLPAVRVDAEHVDRLIADIDAEDVQRRMEAQESLERMGDAVLARLRAALGVSKSLEASARLQASIEAISSPAALPPEDLRRLRGLDALAWIGSPAARSAIEEIGRGEEEARLTREARERLR